MSNFDWTCLDMLIEVPFLFIVVSLNMLWMVLERPWEVLEFDFEKWARTTIVVNGDRIRIACCSGGRAWVGGRWHVPSIFTKAGLRGTMSRGTANKKLTKLYWPSRKHSPKRLIVLIETNRWRGTTKKFLNIRPCILNSFWCHWLVV